MTNMENPVTAAEPAEALSAEAQARVRAQECSDAIAQVLAQYRCAIVPYITAEQVGSSHLPPTKVLTVAAYAIIPQF